VVTIIDRYYNVLQQRDAVINAKNNWERKIDSRKRLEMEAETGRKTQFDVDEARQSELNARNSHVGAQRSYEDALDNFKVNQLSVSTDANIVLDQSELKALEDIGISQPDYMLEEAIETALLRRLDLANTADKVDDVVRNVVLAAEGLGPQLNITGSINYTSPGDPETDFQKLRFHEGIYNFGFNTDSPLDRKNQRNAYRTALIRLEQQQRQYDEDRDGVELGVRSRYRQMLERAESYRIQKMSLDLAQRRVESNKLLLDAGRGTVRILLDSQDALLNAQDNVTTALVNHLIAKLNFFTDIGVLQVKPDGMWEQEKEWQITKTEDKEAITAEVSQDL
jgi:outer membrane protein TolC